MWLRAVTDRVVAEFSAMVGRRGWRLDYRSSELALFVRELQPDVDAELSLSLAEREWGLSINPVLSVRHKVVSDLFTRFIGGSGLPASTVGASLIGLLWTAGRTDKLRWMVRGPDDVSAVVADIWADLEQYGSSFYERHSSLPKMIGAMESSASDSVRWAHLAVAYMVAGQGERALSVLERLEDMAETEPPLMAEQTRRFVNSFRAYFDIANTAHGPDVE